MGFIHCRIVHSLTLRSLESLVSSRLVRSLSRGSLRSLSISLSLDPQTYRTQLRSLHAQSHLVRTRYGRAWIQYGTRTRVRARTHTPPQQQPAHKHPHRQCTRISEVARATNLGQGGLVQRPPLRPCIVSTRGRARRTRKARSWATASHPIRVSRAPDQQGAGQVAWG